MRETLPPTFERSVQELYDRRPCAHGPPRGGVAKWACSRKFFGFATLEDARTDNACLAA